MVQNFYTKLRKDNLTEKELHGELLIFWIVIMMEFYFFRDTGKQIY